MSIDWTNGLVELKTTSAVCSFVAAVMTIARLYLRRKRFWWDDAWAFVSMLCLVVQVASAFMHVQNPQALPKTTRVAAYYIMASSFYAIIWSARLSILLSILRLEPVPAHRARLRAAALVFGACAIFLVAQLFWVCEPEARRDGWKEAPSPQCRLTKQVAVCQVVTDVVSDLFLCIWPLRILRGLRDGRLKRRLKVIFSTSIVTTIVSLVHVGYLLTTGGINLEIAALAEDTVSLMVANLPVVFTAFLRLVGALHAGSDDHVDSDEGAATTLDVATLKFRSRPARPGGVGAESGTGDRELETESEVVGLTRGTRGGGGGGGGTPAMGMAFSGGTAPMVSVVQPSAFGTLKSVSADDSEELGRDAESKGASFGDAYGARRGEAFSRDETKIL